MLSAYLTNEMSLRRTILLDVLLGILYLCSGAIELDFVEIVITRIKRPYISITNIRSAILEGLCSRRQSKEMGADVAFYFHRTLTYPPPHRLLFSINYCVWYWSVDRHGWLAVTCSFLLLQFQVLSAASVLRPSLYCIRPSRFQHLDVFQACVQGPFSFSALHIVSYLATVTFHLSPPARFQLFPLLCPSPVMTYLRSNPPRLEYNY